MELTNWAPAHSDALRKHFALGKSFAEIARAINAEFDTNYSRCATIGRARRLGLGKGEQTAEVATVTPKTQVPDPRRIKQIISKWLVPEFERMKMPQLRCVDLEPRHLSLLELEAGDCRYPYGGDDEGEAITFCGHPKRENSNYCTAHFHLTRDPDTMRERAVRTASLRVVEAA